MKRFCAVATSVLICVPANAAWFPLVYSQPTPQPAPAASAAAPGNAQAAFSQEELEQIAAPVALYPDSLIAQIFMASTYPLEVVEAERWVKANPNLKDDPLAKALNEKTWDASVKSLTGFPDVLTMMSEKIEWTTKLGDAFIGQQKELMATVQKLRGKAKGAGNLKSNEQQVVEVKQEGGTEVIVIESSSPQVVYVPQYDPVVVYGSWPYPSYPPYSYYPPGYVAGTALLSFGVGMALGAAWGHAWGGCNWGGNNVNIDIDRNTNFNRNIDRTKIKNDMSSKGLGNGRGNWNHDPSHRKGASYRDNATAQKFGKGTDARTAQARDSYRGRAESGRQDLSRGSADQFRGTNNAATRGGANTANRGTAGAANRGTTGASNRATTGASNRSSGSGRSPSATTRPSGSSSSAFSGSSRSSSSTRAASSRGSSSRSSAGGASRGGGSRGGGGRGGGGRR